MFFDYCSILTMTNWWPKSTMSVSKRDIGRLQNPRECPPTSIWIHFPFLSSSWRHFDLNPSRKPRLPQLTSATSQLLTTRIQVFKQLNWIIKELFKSLNRVSKLFVKRNLIDPNDLIIYFRFICVLWTEIVEFWG